MNAKSSSTLTAGDTLSLASDLIKLLTPVLKETDKAKFENLKKNSQAVQNVFRRLLNGEPIVKDYGDPKIPATIRYENKLEKSFDPFVFDEAISFVVETSLDSGCLSVTILAKYGDEFIEGWKHTFTKLKTPIHSDGFVAIESISDRTSDPFFWVQDKLVAEKGKLTFLDYNGDCRINITCGQYHEDELIEWELMRMLLPKGKEVTT